MTRLEVISLARTQGIRVPPNVECYNGNTYKEYTALMEENFIPSATRTSEPYAESFYRKHFPEWYGKK